MALERFVFNPTEFQKVLTVKPLYYQVLMKVGDRLLKKRADAQGIGRHSQDQIEQLCKKDLFAISKLLNKNKFFLGDDPCQDDCAIFGMLAQVMWGLPNSPYEKLVQGMILNAHELFSSTCWKGLLSINQYFLIVDKDLTNLRDYTFRMRDRYYPDWDQCIRRPSKDSQLKLKQGVVSWYSSRPDTPER